MVVELIVTTMSVEPESNESFMIGPLPEKGVDLAIDMSITPGADELLVILAPLISAPAVI